MIFADGLLGLIVMGLWLFCIIDVITTDEASCRNLPKILWLMIVIILFDIGAILWLIAGSPRTGRALTGMAAGGRSRAPQSRYPEYERPGRQSATNPDDDDDFLRQCRERAEQQRQAYKRDNPGDLAPEN